MAFIATATLTLMSTLSERIQSAMQAANKTQADLARATGAKGPSVSNWVRGRTKNLRGRNLVIVARLLNVSEAWLSAGAGPRERPERHRWPFMSITPEQWESASPETQRQVETYASYLLERGLPSHDAPERNYETGKATEALKAHIMKQREALRHNATQELKSDATETDPDPLQPSRARSGSI